MGESGSSVSILIPAYNEEDTIGKVIDRVTRLKVKHDITVIDDGSTDRTPEIVANFPGVRLIQNEKNLGKGKALKKAFKEVKSDIYIILDADNTYEVEKIPEMVNLLKANGAPMVIGKRVPEDRAITPLHGLGNRIFNFMVKTLHGIQVTDMLSGLRVIKREALEKIEIEKDGFAVETELTIKIGKTGEILEIPSSYTCRPKNNPSKLHSFKDGWRIIQTILGLKYDWIGKKGKGSQSSHN